MSLHFTDHKVTAIPCHLCKETGSNILYTIIRMYRDAWIIATVLSMNGNMTSEAMTATIKALSIKDKLEGIRELFSVDF